MIEFGIVDMENMNGLKKTKIFIVYEETCSHKIRACINCNGLGWIAWKSNNNNSQSTIILYSICIRCQLN